MNDIVKEIFAFKSDDQFEKLSLKLFHFQYNNNKIYRDFCNFLKKKPENIKSVKGIPFLPVEFFKNKEIVSVEEPYEKVFVSSGTTGAITSRHFVKEYSIYEKSFEKAFNLFYGDLSQYCILALLPSYLEREGSSLVDMASRFIELSGNKKSGFFLNEYEKLKEIIIEQEEKRNKTILLGVTFALLDFAEKFPLKLKNTIIMETGGMKGRRKELTRQEMHLILSDAFGIEKIHSEYGMTELMSQAYSKGNGKFYSPPWMKILIRDQHDPFTVLENNTTGGINIIDLANIYSCSFIETKDLGKINSDGSFEVVGRFDNSDIRGCNLMVSN